MVRTSTLKPAVPVAVIYRPAGLAGSSSLAKCQFQPRGAGRGLPGHAGQSVVLAGAALPVLITGLDCEQVRQEMTRLSGRVNQLSGRLDKAATKDKTWYHSFFARLDGHDYGFGRLCKPRAN